MKFFNDLTGKRYGMITVRKRIPNRVGKSQSKVRWIADCDCGNSFEVDGADLYRADGKRRVSCGCMNHRRGTESPFWKSSNEISSTYWSAVRANAKNRNLEFSITIEYAYSLFCGCCSLTGDKIVLGQTASLDRIDSNQGYIDGNVQWVHVDINILKSDFDQQEFIELCRKVAKYNDKQ